MLPLKVLILCGQSPRHLYVANRLCISANVQAIVHESGDGISSGRLRKLLRPKVLVRKSWRWLRDRRRYRGNPEASYFFGAEEPALQYPELVRYVPNINSRDLVAIADELGPDLIVVFGTSLIRGPLLDRGRLGIVNLHGGLSPHYRGADCTFWALYNGEPEQVGCTIHYINAGIDTGKLIAHVCPQIKSGDNELTLFWRAVKDSAEVYAELIAKMSAGEEFGQIQCEKGNLYQVKDRGFRHELKLDAAIKRGLLDNVSIAPRVTWFPKID